MYQLSNLSSDYALAFSILFFADFAVMRRIFKSSMARWFALHAVANAFIAYQTAGDVYNIFRRPEAALYLYVMGEDDRAKIDYSNTVMLGALHMYHFLMFWKDITREDIFHHVLFVVFNQAAIFWPVIFRRDWTWGSVINGFNFFTCGLPGGIDYAFLSLLKEKKERHDKDVKTLIMKHKRTQAFINVWLRAPGILMCCSISGFECARNWHTTKDDMAAKTIPLLAMMILGYNALHYLERVVASAGKKAEFRGSC
eukprot:g1044.t1